MSGECDLLKGMDDDVLDSGRAQLSSILIPLLLLTCIMAGCGGGSTAPASVAQGAALNGLVRGGQQPVTGSAIYLYAAGASGNGSVSTSLLNTSSSGVTKDSSGNGYVSTDSSGSFNITGDWNCVHGTDQVYILALGGNPGLTSGTDNSALALMAALGTCSSLVSTYPFINIDEVTTVASVWALHPFISDATHIGSSLTNAAGLAKAFAQVPNLVSIVTGVALTTTPGGNGTVPRSKINTLANILASCINSTGNASAICSTLFTAATPTGSARAVDTITAALYIAQNPALNVSSLYGLPTASAPFEPQLNTAPHDWMLSVGYSGGGLHGPASLGVDGSGNVWVANYYGAVSEFSSIGLPLSGTGFTSGGLNESYGLAIDTNNNIWIANEQSLGGVNGDLGTITELNANGQPLSGSSGYDAGGIYFPMAIAADPNGNMWVVDYGDSKVSLLSNNGTSLSGTSGWGGSSLVFPVALAVDSNHNAWVANQSANTITRISASGSTTIISCCEGASGIATDQKNNVWVANYYGDSISEVSSSGTVLLNGITGGGVQHPQGIAVDGSGTVWVANYRGNSISTVDGSSSISPGTFLSPLTGYGLDAALEEPYAIALDASGNAWVSNFGNNTITQFIGVATPIKTPLAGPPAIP